MTSPAELMKAVSDATGISLATIVDIDRKLVKAGLRTKAGRGPNAARMTYLDAARLLTAVLASPQANAAAETVERYQRAEADQRHSSEGLYAAIDIRDLADLPSRHSFVEALAALLRSAAIGSLAALRAVADNDGPPHIEVFAFSRATAGRIRLSGLPNGLTAAVEYRLPPLGPSQNHNAGDLEQSRRITQRTIGAVADLFAKED